MLSSLNAIDINKYNYLSFEYLESFTSSDSSLFYLRIKINSIIFFLFFYFDIFILLLLRKLKRNIKKRRNRIASSILFEINDNLNIDKVRNENNESETNFIFLIKRSLNNFHDVFKEINYLSFNTLDLEIESIIILFLRSFLIERRFIR